MLNHSIKIRLILFIMLPLLIVAGVLSYWNYNESQQATQLIFDNNLKIITLAISRDVAISGGDALSSSTHALIDKTSGGRIYYHVRAVDGSFLAGYGYPPLLPTKQQPLDVPMLYNSNYQQKPMRAAQLIEYRDADGIRGNMVTIVWQEKISRDDFAFALAFSQMLSVVILMSALVIIIFVSINIGLKPLSQIEDAIAKRNVDDISPIKRQVPNEVKGIVNTINDLFAKLSHAMRQQERFISSAAHQLRNPIASIRALSEDLQQVSKDKDICERIDLLANTSAHITRLSQQLLSYDKLTNHQQISLENLDIIGTFQSACSKAAPALLQRNINISFESNIDKFIIAHNPLLLGEVIDNLIDNALKHGDDGLKNINIDINKDKNQLCVTVSNDGAMIDKEIETRIFYPFEQSNNSQGNGLGLAIIWEIIQQHHGDIRLYRNDNDGVEFQITFVETTV